VFFSEFLEGWLERFRQRVRPSTYSRGVQALRSVRELGRWRVHEIRAGEVEDRIAAVGRRAPRQASIALQLLKQVFRSAEQRGHRVDAAIYAVRAPRYEEREPRFLLWSEVERLGELLHRRRRHRLCCPNGSPPRRSPRAPSRRSRPGEPHRSSRALVASGHLCEDEVRPETRRAPDCRCRRGRSGTAVFRARVGHTTLSFPRRPAECGARTTS
jgi:hypothetical protein